jgi:uncharacterized membrane protein
MLFEKGFFRPEEEDRLKKAIGDAEKQTSGEIRLHMEPYCKIDVLDRAADIFGFLHMHETAERNGVLFYVAYKDHRFAIIGDAGINAVVPANFWDEIKEDVISSFKQGDHASGLERGIRKAGEQLKAHFPFDNNDKNELSDEISYGR